MNSELESMRAEISALRSEMENRAKGDANRERRLDLMEANVRDLVNLCGKLHASLAALQNAVEAMGTRRN
jgi:hypothetical protein